MDEETEDAKALREFAESLSDVLNFVDAHRAECLDHGYSPEAAEQMAVHMHGYIVQSLRQALAKKEGFTAT